MWRESLDDFWWADRFGWDPVRTGEQDAVRLARLRATTVAIDEGRGKRAKEDSDAHRG